MNGITEFYHCHKLIPFFHTQEKKYYVFVFYLGDIEDVFDDDRIDLAFQKAKNYITTKLKLHGFDRKVNYKERLENYLN